MRSEVYPGQAQAAPASCFLMTAAARQTVALLAVVLLLIAPPTLPLLQWLLPLCSLPPPQRTWPMRPGDSGAPGWRRSSYPWAKVQAEPCTFVVCQVCLVVWKASAGSGSGANLAGAAAASLAAASHPQQPRSRPTAITLWQLPVCMYLMHSRVL